jgi:hypothetical protein
MAKYEVEIKTPPGPVTVDSMGQMHVRIRATGSEPSAQVYCGYSPNPDQGPLSPAGSDEYEGDINVPNSDFTLYARAEWTQASGEIQIAKDSKATYRPA